MYRANYYTGSFFRYLTYWAYKVCAKFLLVFYVWKLRTESNNLNHPCLVSIWTVTWVRPFNSRASVLEFYFSSVHGGCLWPTGMKSHINKLFTLAISPKTISSEGKLPHLYPARSYFPDTCAKPKYVTVSALPSYGFCFWYLTVSFDSVSVVSTLQAHANTWLYFCTEK